MQFEDQGRDKAATISSSVRIHYVFNLRKIDGSEYLSVFSGMQLSLAYHFIMMGCRLGWANWWLGLISRKCPRTSQRSRIPFAYFPMAMMSMVRRGGGGR